MRILDRYIFKSVLNLFFGCLAVFFCLYITIDIFANLNDILKQHVSIYILLRYYISYLPIIFSQVTPIALLLATLYTFGKLNRNNEIIAMRSSGMSVFQITKTILIFGIIIGMFVFFVNDKLVPQALSLTQKIKGIMETGGKKIQLKGQEVFNNVSMYGMNNRLFFVNKFSVSTNTMEGIIILEQDEKQDITKKIVASKGIYTEGYWRFYQCITYNFDRNGQILDEPVYREEELMTIPETPREFLTQRQHPDYMNINQLKEYIWKLSNSGATTVIRNLKVDLYNRYTSAITVIIIILIGIPSALRMKKRATGLSSLGLAIVMGFLYYVLSAVSTAMGKAGVFVPILAATFPHIIFLLIALYLIDTLP